MPIKESGEENVRFKLIRSFNKPSLYTYYMDPAHWGELFDNSYYETKFYRFKRFIKDLKGQGSGIEGFK